MGTPSARLDYFCVRLSPGDALSLRSVSQRDIIRLGSIRTSLSSVPPLAVLFSSRSQQSSRIKERPGLSSVSPSRALAWELGAKYLIGYSDVAQDCGGYGGGISAALISDPRPNLQLAFRAGAGRYALLVPISLGLQFGSE